MSWFFFSINILSKTQGDIFTVVYVLFLSQNHWTGLPLSEGADIRLILMPESACHLFGVGTGLLQRALGHEALVVAEHAWVTAALGPVDRILSWLQF